MTPGGHAIRSIGPETEGRLAAVWERRDVPPLGTVLARGGDAPPRPWHDAQSLAEANGWLIPYSPGRWFYAGLLLDLFQRMRQRLRAGARELGFTEYLFPRMLTRSTSENFRLLEIFPASLFRCDGGRGDSGYLDAVQCAPFYDLLGRLMEAGVAMPVRAFEDGGYTFRDEAPGRLQRFSTAREFLRGEFVFAGAPEQVIVDRMRVLEALAHLLDALGLDWRAVVGRGCMDPECGIELAAGGGDEHPLPPDVQPSGRTIPVIDLEVALGPGAADTADTNREWLECVGGTLHFHSKIGRAPLPPPAALWSACVGFGVNRACYAYLCRHGGALGPMERVGAAGP